MAATVRPLPIAIPACGVLALESIHGPGFRMRREKHPFHELFYVQRGRIRFVEGEDEAPLVVGAGGFLPMSRNAWHRLEDESPATVMILAFSPDFIERDPVRRPLWNALAGRAHRAIFPPADRLEKLDEALRTILAEQVSTLPGREALVQGEALRLLATLAREPDAPLETGSHARVAAIVRRLHERFYEPWDVDSAARQAHLSRRRFVQIFREQTGSSLVDLRNRLRVEHAARLIEEDRATVAGAAFSCGFGDVTHFYRLFRRRFGVPPAQWRGTRQTKNISKS